VVLLNYALEQDLSEEADVASHTKIFSNHLICASKGTFLGDTLTLTK